MGDEFEHNDSKNLYDALEKLSEHLIEMERLKPISFSDFLELSVNCLLYTSPSPRDS